MTGQLSPEASAQIAGSIIPTSASSRTLANTRSTAGLASSGSASATTGTRGIGANAQTTANTTVAKVQDTGAAMTGMNMAKTASLAAFMGTAAYLAL